MSVPVQGPDEATFNELIRKVLSLEADQVDWPHRHPSLSFHDHWLSEAEAASRPMFHPMFVDAGMEDVYLEFERAFVAFVAGLHAWTPIFTAELVEEADGMEALQLEKAADWPALEKRLIPALREESSLELVFPEHRALMISGFDLTWHLWLFEPVSQAFLARLQTSGVHLLP